MKYLKITLALPFIWLGLVILAVGTRIRFDSKLTLLIFKGLGLSVDNAVNLEKEKQKNG